MVDLSQCESVQVQLGAEGQVWINVDGKCELRIGKAKHVAVDNERDSDDLPTQIKTVLTIEE